MNKLIIGSWLLVIVWHAMFNILSAKAAVSREWIHASPNITRRYSLFFWDNDPGILAWIRPWINMGLVLLALGITSLYSQIFWISIMSLCLLFARIVYGSCDNRTNGSSKRWRFVAEIIMGFSFVYWLVVVFRSTVSRW
jgi:hypothetical protein